MSDNKKYRISVDLTKNGSLDSILSNIRKEKDISTKAEAVRECIRIAGGIQTPTMEKNQKFDVDQICS